MARALFLPADCLGYYHIPLNADSCKLSLLTLNQHSDFRRPLKRPYLYCDIVEVGFDFGLLTLRVQVERDSPFQLVYICVNKGYLSVTCNAGTDASFLSKHAYMALHNFLFYRSEADFERYNWYDFFEEGKKKSKYLDVICDRRGLDIKPKDKYLKFWKPGHQLLQLHHKMPASLRSEQEVDQELMMHTNREEVFGYLLVDPMSSYREFNHLPFLLPFVGVLNKAGTEVKRYLRVLTANAIADIEITPLQAELNAMAFEMEELAWALVENRDGDLPNGGLLSTDRDTAQQQLLAYWHKALPLLCNQPYLAYYLSSSRRPINDKPRKANISKSHLSRATPKLCFTWRSKGTYFELRMKFKIGNQIYEPYPYHTLFFISPLVAPTTYYLLDQMQDVATVAFFYEYNCGFAVLKEHDDSVFEQFMESLRGCYEFI